MAIRKKKRVKCGHVMDAPNTGRPYYFCTNARPALNAAASLSRKKIISISLYSLGEGGDARKPPRPRRCQKIHTTIVPRCDEKTPFPPKEGTPNTSNAFGKLFVDIIFLKNNIMRKHYIYIKITIKGKLNTLLRHFTQSTFTRQ